jgi:hypothetical protein
MSIDNKTADKDINYKGTIKNDDALLGHYVSFQPQM